MLKFIPDLVELQRDQISNQMIILRNESVYNNAEDLNKKYDGIKCNIHPDKDSTILVKLKDVEEFLEVKECCCKDFKAELDQIVEAETHS